MTRRRLARVFWLGAAAILVAAALVSLAAILKGGFSDTDERILGTLGSLLYTGAAALAALALVERGSVPLLGWVVLGLSGITFVLFAVAIWGRTDEDGETAWRLAMSGALYLLAGLVATTGSPHQQARAPAAGCRRGRSHHARRLADPRPDLARRGPRRLAREGDGSDADPRSARVLPRTRPPTVVRRVARREQATGCSPRSTASTSSRRRTTARTSS